MIDILNVQPNQPSANLEDFTFLIYGQAKSGKTTLFYELAKRHFKGDLSKALLIAFESGYKALNNVYKVDITKWEDFLELSKQLIEKKEQITYRLLGIDTLDVMHQYAAEYVVKRERIARKDPKIKSISDIAWGQGYSLLEEEVSRQINKLISAGFGLFLISHCAEKQFTSRDGTQYDKTTISLPNRIRNTFINMSDFICFVDIIKEKEGDRLLDNRYIFFRSEGDVEAGSRFKNVPEKIPYDPELFLEVFENAVLHSYDHNAEEMVKAKEEQAQEREERAKEFIRKETEEFHMEEAIKEMTNRISEIGKDTQDQVKAAFKESFGSFNYKKFTEEQLKRAKEILENLV